MHAYVLRHVDRSVAEDVVADTFLVAWRRIDDIPAHSLAWLLVVARHTIAKHHRSVRRRRELQDSLVRVVDLVCDSAGLEEQVTDREALVRALAQLRDNDREALLLVAWDGLSQSDAAQVAGCSLASFRVRLHRARRRLSELADDADPPRPAPARPLTLTPLRGQP
ncbi:RNA polymerase sigma factor [Isoptericola sp. NPDC056134]|uniref:RNA polymerase sigma factor n=1 Tax=Isoptericola sp. NPDC056134 TaxID=3345723 RepID=UPI0035EB3B9C